MEEQTQLKTQIWNETIYGDVLQSIQWGAVKETEGWHAIEIFAQKNGEVIASALCLIKKAGFLGNYLYVPHGPVFKDFNSLQQAMPELKEKLLVVARTYKCFAIEIEPKIAELKDEPVRLTENLQPFCDPEVLKEFIRSGFSISGRNMQPKYKLYYDLGATEEQLLAQMKKNTRYNVHLAEKKGVSVIEYKLDDPQIDLKVKQFYDLLKETQARAGGYPIRPYSTFQALAREFKGTDHMSIFDASYNGKTIAMNITFKTKYWSSSFYGASNREFPEVKAAYLLRWKSVLAAKAYGSKIYDFWGIIPNDGQHKGYSDTKVSFGGVRMDTYGILAMPLDSTKFFIWDKLLPIRAKLAGLFRR